MLGRQVLNACAKFELLCPLDCVKEVLDVGPHNSTHLLLARSHVHRPWRKVHSHVTDLISQTVEPEISSGMSRGNTHPRTGYQGCTQMKEH